MGEQRRWRLAAQMVTVMAEQQAVVAAAEVFVAVAVAAAAVDAVAVLGRTEKLPEPLQTAALAAEDFAQMAFVVAADFG